jgi:hypothetical protein
VNSGDDDRNLNEAAGETTTDFGAHFLDELDNGPTATTEAETTDGLPSGSALVLDSCSISQ